MKNERLLYAIGEIDDELINSANVNTQKSRKKKKILKWGTLAACLCIAVVVVFNIVLLNNGNDGAVDSELSPISMISEIGEGMGEGNYKAHDVLDIVNNNPWNESMNISTLPVYHNPMFDSEGIPNDEDFSRMETALKEVATRLGLDVNSLDISDDTPNEEKTKTIIFKLQTAKEQLDEESYNKLLEEQLKPRQLIAKTDDYSIETDGFLCTTIEFLQPKKLPSKYNYEPYSSYKNVNSIAEYLKNEFKELIGFENPQMDIRSARGKITNGFQLFDASGANTNKILNYNFNRVDFIYDEAGKMNTLIVYRLDDSEKKGDYPIITKDEATQLLLEGNYISASSQKVKGEKYIKWVELVYNTSRYDEYYMPYYRFDVELPQKESEDGLKTFGAFYVPAVESSYITNMPNKIQTQN